MTNNNNTVGWATTTVGEVATLIRGITYKKDQTSKIPQQNLKPILRATNINGVLNYEDLVFIPENLISSEQFIKAGDIIFAMSSGSKHLVGKSARSRFDYDGSYGAFCSLLRPCESVCKDFLYYVFQNNKFRRLISEVAKGSNINNLKREHINDFEIQLPPLAEQHRIVAKIEALFSELDKGIESFKTAREQLKIYRQALLKHAFSGKLTEQWRAENQDKLESAEALLQRIQTEREQHYQQQLKDWETTGKQGSKPKAPKTLPPLTTEELAELPELPEGWAWVRLGDVFSDNPKNGIYKPSDHYGSGISIIRIDDFYDGLLCKKSGFKKVELSVDEIKTFTAHIGDILINRVNSIEYLGKCCEVKGLAEPVVFESNIMKITIFDNFASNFFVTSYLSSHSGRQRLCKNAKHAVNQASINQTDVSLTPIPLTQLNEKMIISERLETYLSEIDQLDQTLTTALQQAEALRQSILKKAFSGQLVPQDANDEPASVLLERIQAEKAALVAPIKIRNNYA